MSDLTGLLSGHSGTVLPFPDQLDMNNSVNEYAVQPTHDHGVRLLTEQQAHVVQLYSDDGLLLDVLCRFIGGAMAVGDGALIVATRGHHEGLLARMKARGLDPSNAIAQGRFVQLNAEEVLPRFMVDGRVDDARFMEIIGAVLTQVRGAYESKNSRIAVFGELVALLWAEGKPHEAIRVEQLWNDLARNHEFSLLCAYPMTGFDNDRHIEPFLKVCYEHSGILPSESYLGLSRAEERLHTIAELPQKTKALKDALQLRHSEERFRLLVEAVQDYAIFMLDPNGHIVSWNIGAQRIKGYHGAEIIGRHFSCFYPQEDLDRGKPEWELRVAAKEGRLLDEGWRIRKDGSRFWASVVITAVHDHTGKLIGFAKVTRDFTEHRRAQEALRLESIERREAERRLHDSENSLRELSRHLLRTQDEERRRIGRELHDSLGQSLAAIKINLDSLVAAASPNDSTSKRAAECIQLTETAIKEVRTISYLLYPPMLEEMGLQSAIPWYLDGFSTRSGIQTRFDLRGDVGRLCRSAELALFRVLQEGLTNIHRHSESPTADIRLITTEDWVILEIQDYGKGMAPDLLEQSNPGRAHGSGVGLRGMYERMLQMGGRLELVSDAEGTTVRAAIPSARCASKDTDTA